MLPAIGQHVATQRLKATPFKVLTRLVLRELTVYSEGNIFNTFFRNCNVKISLSYTYMEAFLSNDIFISHIDKKTIINSTKINFQ
jgi:hypothetical protein